MVAKQDVLDQKIAERERLEKEIAKLMATQRKERLAEIRKDIERFEFTPEELFGKPARASRKTATKAAAKSKRKTAAGGKVEPKYRDPETGATWTGRGRAPKWIEGRNREDFLIK